MKIKGHSATAALPAACAAGRLRGNRDTFPTYEQNSPNGKKADRTSDVGREIGVEGLVCTDSFNHASNSREASILRGTLTTNAYVFIYSLKCIFNSYANLPLIFILFLIN